MPEEESHINMTECVADPCVPETTAVSETSVEIEGDDTKETIPEAMMEDNLNLKELFSKFDPSNSNAKIIAQARILSANYLGGAWEVATAEQFSMKVISGGLSNFLFLVSLDSSVQLLGAEPNQALLRIHCAVPYFTVAVCTNTGSLPGWEHLSPSFTGSRDRSLSLTTCWESGSILPAFVHTATATILPYELHPLKALVQYEIMWRHTDEGPNQVLMESLIFTILSERGLGPKLYSVFPGGRFSKLTGPVMARIHSLNIPMAKGPQLVYAARNWLNSLRTTTVANQAIELHTTKAKVDKAKVPTSVTLDDLETELKFVEKFLRVCGSPIVFCHNDLHEFNILLVEGCDVQEDGQVLHSGKMDSNMEPLIPIDFEFANYNYRGFDLAHHLAEYAFDYAVYEPPYYNIYNEMFDAEAEKRTFVEAYVDSLYKMRDAGEYIPKGLITGDREKDIDTIFEEACLFILLSHFYWSYWSFVKEQDCHVKFDFGSCGRDRLALYYNGKHRLEEFIARKCQQ